MATRKFPRKKPFGSSSKTTINQQMPTNTETTLKQIDGRIITLNYNLVSDDPLFFLNHLAPEDKTDSMALNLQNCFMLRGSPKSGRISTETTLVTPLRRCDDVDNPIDSNGLPIKDTSRDYLQSRNHVNNNSSYSNIVHKTIKTRRRTTKEKKFICKVCQRGYVHKLAYEKHCLAHTKDEVFKCNICDKAFPKKDNMTKHVKKVHMPGKIYGCSDCPKLFRSSAGLREHRIAYHMPNEDVSCPTCRRSFSAKKSLKYHLTRFSDHVVEVSDQV